VNAQTRQLAIKWEDEILAAVCLSRDGQVVHSAFKK
jgi:NAD(P) transhydrogenase subunit alpha